ncbi:MAG: LTA synthase family protein [Myxococcota bacterium]|nr:LTA synthase family protein [Myxococcota bacterium]
MSSSAYALPSAHLVIGVWLVVASRWMAGTSVSVSGVFDDASLVAGFVALHCLASRLSRTRRGIGAALSMLLTLLLGALLLTNHFFFAFFHTNLNLSSFSLAGIAVDATTSIVELASVANVTAFLIVPLALEIGVARLRREGADGSAWLGFVFATLLLAGLASATRHPVFIFPDQNPAMSLVREATRGVQDLLLPRSKDALEGRQLFALFNREGYEGYEFDGTSEHPMLQRAVKPSDPAPARNVVLILMESVRALEMQGEFEQVGVTPTLNALEEKSLVFPNFYYNGMRTVDGEYAILCSALPMVEKRPIYMANPNLGIRCLPQILREHGYQTHWLSAYRSSYANKAGFLSNHGVSYIHDDESMDRGRATRPDIGWGMSDLDMFEQVAEKMNGFREPFFAEIMTLSNHHPFDHDYGVEAPAGIADVDSTQHYRDYLRGVHFTDHAIGKFFEIVRSAPWFDNTLFVILGDHSIRSYPSAPDGSPYGPVLQTEIYFRGGLILHGPGWLPAERRDVLGSQIDLAPTILDLLDIRGDNSFLGVSLLADLPPERRFALMSIGHVWNMRVGDHYCYAVGYSCFESVFPRCAKDVRPSFEGHSCFEASGDLLAGSDATASAVELSPLERLRVLERAGAILEVNRVLTEEDRFR